jgi:hypothetical protein
MNRFQTAAKRVLVLLIVYVMSAQTLLASASGPNPQNGSQSVTCGQTGTRNNIPAHDSASCALSCCLAAAAAWMPASPIILYSPLRDMDMAAWDVAEVSFSGSRLVTHFCATGPPSF